MYRVWVCLVAVLLHVQDARGDQTCGANIDGKGTTFDLSPLTQSLYYRLDATGLTEENYSFAFNICANVTGFPPSGPPGTLGKGCVETATKGETMKGPAPAYQIAHADDFCYRLGDSSSNVEYSLFEPEDPSRGVVMRYNGGNLCSNNVRRSLEIAFPCSQEINIPDKESVEEVSQCVYKLIVPSIYGCPTQCGVKDRQLCNAKGVCRYDETKSASRCFCDDGFTGDDCGSLVQEVAGKETDGAALGILIAVSILIAIVIAGLAVMWLKIRGLRLDPQAYATLSDGGRLAQEEL